MRELPFSTIEKYLSDYLMRGWKEEDLRLQQVEVDDGHVAGYEVLISDRVRGVVRAHGWT